MNNNIHPEQLQRASGTDVKLILAGIAGNLVLASAITMSLIGGMVLVLVLGLVFITGSENPGAGFVIAVAITLIFNIAAFFISPWLMDLSQKWLYQTRWVSLADIAQQSPETAEVIQRVCNDKKLKQPRLGIIDDQNPTAFTYGSLPNSARLIVSQGLFTYLEDEEVAAVYAHELGHIVHWDFAVMTFASTMIQICYLIYTYARRMSSKGSQKSRNAMQKAALVAYIFYLIGSYLLLYLSRTREYFADHFAAETTGNPNALSRALVKIAYGIVEEGSRQEEPSRLLEGTRALGIYDARSAASTGTAYRTASSPDKIGRVFLWDLFNPWGWWMELKSTHPLTGKRVRALSTYAEQLGLAIEFDMGKVIRKGSRLNKKALYRNFILDLFLYYSELVVFVCGLIIWFVIGQTQFTVAFLLMGWGLGIIIKILVMFPDYDRAVETDVLKLMSDPYASPLRGQPVKLRGDLIGRGQAGYVAGSDLKLQDKTGMLYLNYSSRFGRFGNSLFGMFRVQSLIGSTVNTKGWFRRGISPWMDFIQLETDSGTVVKSYHRFWLFISGWIFLALGLFFALA